MHPRGKIKKRESERASERLSIAKDTFAFAARSSLRWKLVPVGDAESDAPSFLSSYASNDTKLKFNNCSGRNGLN